MHVDPLLPIVIAGDHHIMALRKDDPAKVQEHYYGMSGISALETRASIRRTWAGVDWEPAISRLWTWENGDFRGSNAVAPGWLVSLSFSPP